MLKTTNITLNKTATFILYHLYDPSKETHMKLLASQEQVDTSTQTTTNLYPLQAQRENMQQQNQKNYKVQVSRQHITPYRLVACQEATMLHQDSKIALPLFGWNRTGNVQYER